MKNLVVFEVPEGQFLVTALGVIQALEPDPDGGGHRVFIQGVQAVPGDVDRVRLAGVLRHYATVLECAAEIDSIEFGG